MPARDQPPPDVITPSFPHTPLHEINERFVELLISETRLERRAPHPLAAGLREVLLALTPEARHRAAQRSLLLADLRFQDDDHWRAIRPGRPIRTGRPPSSSRSAFPRRAAAPLARATLTLAWYSLRSDREAALILLGMSPTVASVIEQLPLPELDPIGGAQWPHLQPRWPDQPELWRELFRAAQENRIAALWGLDVRGLQLVTGSLLARVQSLASPHTPERARGNTGRPDD